MPPVITKDTRALEKYQAEVAANPQNPDAHANLGWGYYGKGQLSEAMQAFQQALTLKADHLEAQYGLALAHRAASDKAAAAAAFEKAKALAAQIEDKARQQMLTRLITGHLNALNTGDWNLGRHEVHA